MENINIDELMDVPDTPDRLTPHISRAGGGHETYCNSKNFDQTEEKLTNGHRPRGVGEHFTENGHNRRFAINLKNIISDEGRDRSNTVVLSPLENSRALQKGNLFRRPVVDKGLSQETNRAIGVRNDKGKTIRIKHPSKSIEQNDQGNKSEMVFQHGTSRDLLSQETSQRPIKNAGVASAHFVSDSSKRSNYAFKGKEKVDDNAFQGLSFTPVHRRGADISSDHSHKSKKQLLVHCDSIPPPRVTGQKRLVRNGCIAPHNIANRDKHLAEPGDNSLKTVEQSRSGNIAPISPTCLIDISDIVVKETTREREKGKQVKFHPYISHKNDGRTIRASSSNNESTIRASDGRVDALRCSQELGGSTHSSQKKDISFTSTDGKFSRLLNGDAKIINQQHQDRMKKQDTVSREGRGAESNYAGNQDAAEPSRAARPFNKRQKKNVVTSRKNGECSDSGVVLIGSSRKSSNLRSSKSRNHQLRAIPVPIFEVDELSPEMRHHVSGNVDRYNNNNSDARFRQVEADEMLARELQEQLYHEESSIRGREFDEAIAMVLQQEENAHHTSGGGRSVSNPRRHSASRQSQRQPRTRPSPSANGRGIRARFSGSTRMTQSRDRFPGQPRTVSGELRNIHLPWHMDLDVRLDMLEALDAAVGDASDVRRSNSVFRAQRDFNENDYEMLLALDENNHQHAGASVNWINNLPQSTVQTDTLEEACAICLDTPTIGDVIRHLPCFHKFHKDCIDPWLNRKTSCPVCKSSIT